MNPKLPAFNFRNTPTEWRSVDLKTVMDIARRCSSGVDWSKCSKSMIYEGIAKPCGHSSKPEKFVYMMGRAEHDLREIHRDHNRQVYQKICEIEAKWEEGDQP